MDTPLGFGARVFFVNGGGGSDTVSLGEKAPNGGVSAKPIEAASDNPQTLPNGSDRRRKHKDITILVVEDETMLVDIFEASLSGMPGIKKVYRAHTGDDAEDILKEYGAEIDVMLTDMEFPYAGCRPKTVPGVSMAIHVDENYPHTLVAAWSARSVDELAGLKALLDAGKVVSFLKKPVHIPQIKQAMADLMEKYPPAESA